MKLGWAIQKWRFSARLLSGWNVVLGALSFITLIVFSNIGCPTPAMPINQNGNCNLDCACPENARINPICAKDGITAFYSPCMAGCTEYHFDKSTRTKFYSNCTCIGDMWTENNMSLTEEWIKKVIIFNTLSIIQFNSSNIYVSEPSAKMK